MKKFISTLLLSILLLLNCNYLALAQTCTEHLMLPKKAAKKTPTNVVVTSPCLKTVLEYNVLEVNFAENFSTKTAKVGDKVGFLLNCGLVTQEGTKVLPNGSQIIAVVTCVEKPKSFNRSGKVTLKFLCVLLPDGTQIPFNAQLFDKKKFLSRGKLNAFGKGLGTTLGMGAVGVGAGCGIGVAAGAVIIGGFAIGLPVGIAVGALAGLVTPGLHYKAKAGDPLLIQLTNNLEVPCP